LQTELESYNTFVYPGFSFPESHPDRLAAMAILHGLTPAPVERCRVLELGCNEGANLIPMAYAIPSSEFVGIDLAHLPIERGQQRIRELGLTNVRIFEGDLLKVGTELGQFDYIIAHGVYAWVPETVRDGLLALCGELLAANGIAVVSYNALPGGHLRKMVREMMLRYVDGIEDPLRRVTEALAFLRFLAESGPEGDAYRQVIEEQLRNMEKRTPESTFHDEFADTYHPVLLTEFVAHARKHGLQYLSEAALPPPTDPCYRGEVRSALVSAAGSDVVRQEQLLDFMRARVYRETLLCRQEHGVSRDFSAEQLRKLLFASQATSAPAEAPGAKVFTLPGGIKMESNHAGAIALLEALGANWPRALSFNELEPMLAGSGFALDAEGVTLLVRLIVSRFVELRTWKAPVAAEISERPRASACGRLESRTRTWAATLLHGTLRLDDPFAVRFLQLLDGTSDRKELLEHMKAEFPDVSTEELEAGIEPGLIHLHRAGMLEA
jgi:SAM-dependent methyltransferase